MACRLAAERIEQDEVDQIRKLLDEHALRDEVLSGEGYYQQSGDFDFHFRIAKAVSGKGKRKATHTTLSVLEGKTRVEELAEMMAGTEHTATTRQQAKELLAAAA